MKYKVGDLLDYVFREPHDDTPDIHIIISFKPEPDHPGEGNYELHRLKNNMRDFWNSDFIENFKFWRSIE